MDIFYGNLKASAATLHRALVDLSQCDSEIRNLGANIELARKRREQAEQRIKQAYTVLVEAGNHEGLGT